MKTINDYAELVKEKHALNKTIAPVETNLTDASREYHIGEQFIIDGGLFKAKTEIAQHDALVLNTNYEPADNLTEQIKNAGGGTGTDPRLDVFENNIAPVETDETDASRAYQVGEQLILDNILYDVIVPISEHDVITTTGSGANIEPADPISSQFQTLTNKLNGEVETRAKLSAHNLFDLNLELIKANNTSGTWNDNAYTINGTTFTINSDKTVNVDTNGGTASANTTFIIDGDSWGQSWTECIVSGCPASGSSDTYRIAVNDGGWQTGDTGNGYESSGTVVALGIWIKSGQTLSNVVFEPMVRSKSDPSTEFTSYAMTNRELTEKTIIKDVVVSPSEGITIDYKHCYKIGNIVFLNFRFLLGSTATVATNAVIATVDKKPKTQILLPSFQTWDGSIGDMVQLNTNGTLVMPSVAKFAINKNFFINACYITED